MAVIFRILKIIWLFQQKLIIPSVATSIVFTAMGLFAFEDFALGNFGLFYFFVSLAYHFFVYELKKSSDYYLYFNLGLSKLCLWLSTILIGILTILITAAI